MTINSKLLAITWLMVILIVPDSIAQESKMADADSKTQQQKALERAKQEQEIAEAKLAEAVAKKKLRELDLPASENTGLDGTITMEENAGYYAELLAIGALKDAATTMARNIEDEKLTIVATTSFNLGEERILWSILNTRISDLRKRAQALLEKHPADGSSITQESLLATLGAAPTILGSIADITKFFKTDRTLKGRNVEISNNALLVAVASALTTAEHTVWIEAFGSTAKPLLLIQVEELLQEREGLLQRAREIRLGKQDELSSLKNSKERVAELKKQIVAKPAPTGDALQTLQEQLSEVEETVAKLQPLEDSIASLELEFADLAKLISDNVESLLSRAGDGKSLIEAVATADMLHANPNAHLLAVELTSKGGEFETTKKVFRSGHISFLGGVGISYVLMDKDSNIIQANVITKRKGAKFKSLNEEDR